MQIERIQQGRQRRKWRSRKNVFGTSERPRLSVFRSNKYIYAQVIDDTAGVTLAAASSLRLHIEHGCNIAAAKAVGVEIAKQAQQVGIKAVCFDRSGYKYHGRIKALADAAREAGLAF